jgi:hypothetical protein
MSRSDSNFLAFARRAMLEGLSLRQIERQLHRDGIRAKRGEYRQPRDA